jgi:DNA-binding NtrC family response regulator
MLIVDDDPDILALLGRFAAKRSFTVVTKSAGQDALEYLRGRSADIALIDVKMPGVDGLQVLRAIREEAPDCRVVLMTGAPDMAVAVEAIKLGAQDVIPKPIDFSRLTRILDAVREENAHRRQVTAIEEHLAARTDFHGMVGRGPGMEALFSLIRRLAPHVRAAVIVGETGTGKELVARALHALGPRAGRPLVIVNCAAIVPTLFESELFGHVRGAFTGASEHKAGVFEIADRGTLLLDEIGELPLEVQSKLLRVLESGETKRVGATEARTVDVHLVAATNRDLLKEVEQGRFRADLFYRLNVIELRVPPLRERREDIPLLVVTFVREFARAFDKPITGVTSGVERTLLEADWPGNVRQLRNVIERACLLADGEWITDVDVPGPPVRPGGGAKESSMGAATASAPLGEIEQATVVAALDACGGNKTHAAARLGISRRALYRLIDGFGQRGPFQLDEKR